MGELVSVEEIRDAAARLAGVAVRPPLVPFPRLSPAVLVKPESLQPVGSFKLRGAYAAISALLARDGQRGVVAHSSGNHGYAVAYAAALLGVHAVVVVPETAPKTKTDAIASCGAELVAVPPTMAARQAAADELAARHGYALIPPFDDRRVIAGQGTIGLEIMADRPDADLVVVPVSGGGLIAGIAAAVRAISPHTKVVGVEPEFAADARDSLRKGERVAWPAASVQRTIADALRVERVGALPFAHMQRDVAAIVTVTDEEMLAAVRRLALEAHLVAEPGGAAAVAACLFRADELPAARTRVAVLSGGNIDPALLARVVGDGWRDGQGGAEPVRPATNL
ncbi:MAG TPA: threonine/serine dehydratase [Streptosporangiaceae bacterium]|jgi:threonine dehydratase|nr:threonine/serine dehydratase [Streptosporangiaceae bacterium]